MGKCVIKDSNLISVCICLCVSLCVCVYICVHVRVCTCLCVHIISSVLCAGPLECCCGKYFLLDTCRTLAKATRKFWSSSPAEDGWTHLRTVPDPCTALLGIFLQVTKDAFPFQKILQPCMLFCFKTKGQIADLI